MAINHPFQARRKKMLTAEVREATLAGGTAGNTQDAPKGQTSVSSAVPTSLGLANSFSTALDALSDMFEGYLSQDRVQLDNGFERLVELIEVWRDAVPKA